jgi:hypothetical protein
MQAVERLSDHDLAVVKPVEDLIAGFGVDLLRP